MVIELLEIIVIELLEIIVIQLIEIIVIELLFVDKVMERSWSLTTTSEFSSKL